MFNLQGSEIIFILLMALVVLGPEKLPGAIRRVTSLYAELRKLSSGFQDEFKSVLDEPLREMKSTADLMKHAADPKRIADEAEREAELKAAAEKKAQQAHETTSAMEAAGAAHLAKAPAEQAEADEALPDAFADPIDEGSAEDPDEDRDRVSTDGDAVVSAVDETLPVPRLSSVDLVVTDGDTGTGDAPDDEAEERSA